MCMKSIVDLIDKYKKMSKDYKQKIINFENKHDFNKLDAIDSFTYGLLKGCEHESNHVVNILTNNTHVIKILRELDNEYDKLKEKRKNEKAESEAGWNYGAACIITLAGNDMLEKFNGGNPETIKAHSHRAPRKSCNRFVCPEKMF